MTKVAALKFDPNRGKWIAEYDGKVLSQSHDKYRVIRQIQESECRKAVEAGVHEIAEIPAEDMTANHAVLSNTNNVVSLPVRHPKPAVEALTLPYFSVNERFDFLAHDVNMVIDGEIPAMIVMGNPGMGKSQTVLEQFENRNLRNILTYMVENNESGERMSGGDGDFIVIKGYSTAKAIYRKLWENRNRSIVFDDCDKALEDKNAISIFKSALDSYEQRIVTWGAERPFGSDDELPSHFEFKGSVIFITNKRKESLDDAIKTRCAKANVWMSIDEVIQRIESTMDNVRQVADVPRSYKEDVIAFFRANRAYIEQFCPDLNYRTFILLCKIRNKNYTNWERHALANLVA
jgi:hypothetical protein